MNLTINGIKSKNKEAGQHFFDRDAMRFFDSRIGKQTYRGKYFITSERFDHNSPRLFSVRECRPDGSINTIGDFQRFKNAASAKYYIANKLTL